MDLRAGSGDDLVVGGAGNDTLTGGPGVDTFHFEGADFGEDWITDFTLGEDKLEFAGEGGADELDDLAYEADTIGGSSTPYIRITFAGLRPDPNLVDEQIVVLGVGDEIEALKADVLFA